MKIILINFGGISAFDSLGLSARLILPALIAGIFVPAVALAQTPPNASILQQQIERDLQVDKQRLPLKPLPPVPAEPPLVGQTVVVSGFKFKGNTLLSDEELRAALAPLVGRPLDFARLQNSPVMVANVYRNKGWVVQTFLPAQDIDQGTVTIEIVEAVFGQPLIAGATATRVPKEEVLRIFARQQQGGKFLNINAVDRALLLADDLPGIIVTGALTQGSQAGQTDMVLQLTDEPLLGASVTADNTGSVSTGSQRVMAVLNINSPSFRGDSFSLTAMATQGSRYARVAYALPLGADGWRVGVNASLMDYRLITAAYKDLNASGDSTTAGLELTYPWLRSRTLNLNTSLSADKKGFHNVSGGSVTSSFKSVPVSLALSGNSLDGWGRGGANSFSWAMTAGELNLDGSPTQSTDATTTQAAGSYKKVRYAFSRQQQLSPSVSLYAAFSGQWANKNLDSSEKFFLGGSSGVRAYPSSEAGGTLGQMLNVELRWQLVHGWSVAGFYDHGRVTVNKLNNFTGAPALNSYALKGAGLGLSWRSNTGLSVQGSFARRLGHNPNPITTAVNNGADQDGTLHINRYWLTGSLAF
jgi:hemolysin activation/secretion protein